MRARLSPLVAALLLLGVAACEPSALPTTTSSDILAPPDGLGGNSGSSSTSTTEAPPVTNDPSPYQYQGYLPNGTDYHASIPGSRMEARILIEGVFFFQGDDGLLPVGEVRYARTGDPPASAYESKVLRLAAGEWLVEVVFLDEVTVQLGAEAEEVITRSIEIEDRAGWPVLSLSSPFTWGVAGALPLAVQFESFSIAAGCDSLSVVCSETRSVQIRALSDIGPGSPEMTQEQREHAWITTSTGRSALDPNYLNPGPLSERLSADLVWTGEEMIVWGGKQARDGLTTLVDGAAFNPETNQWRMIARFPLQGPQATRAVWGDGEMIVVSHNGTFGYSLETDTWQTISNGVVPSEWHDRMLFLDGKVFVWARSSEVHELTLSTGVWRSIDAPISSSTYSDPYVGVLRAVGGSVVAVTHSSCSGKSFWELNDENWEPLPEISLATETDADCSAANQAASAGGELVIWDEENHPSAIFSFEDDAWRDLAPVPLGGTEGPPGPVPMGSYHFLVPRWGEAAIFDATTEQWTRVTLPGAGTDAEMIWTGEEILAWGIWETFDAWRWTPGQTIIGGDDSR